MASTVQEIPKESITIFPTDEEKRNSRSLDLSVQTGSSSTTSSTNTNSNKHQLKRSTSDGGTKKDIMILTSGMPAQNTEDSLSAALPSPTTTVQPPSSPSSSVHQPSLLFNFGLASKKAPSRKQSFCSILQKVSV